MRRLLVFVSVPCAVVVLFLLVQRKAPLPGWLSRRPSNLLVVTLDTVRADHVGAYGYAPARTPRLDALAARGLRFERAATVTPLTLPAHASLFTGTFPARHGVRDNGGYYLGAEQETLAEVLRGRGYRTGGFVSAFVLDSRWGIDQGFERYFDDFDLSRFEQQAGMDAIQRPGGETVDEALGWLAEEPRKPFFLWVHLYDPHAPYAAPPEYARQFPRGLHGAYDAEIAYADAQLGRILDALERDGRLDRTVVAALGDHGEMLGEHGELTHGFFVYDAAVRIPAVVAAPGLAPRAVADQVRIVDLMPTLLELLGVPSPGPVEGTSLLPLARGERLSLQAISESWFPRFHYGWSELVAIQDERFKLIRAPRPELYDLERDPGETASIAASDPQRAHALARALDEALAAAGAGARPRPPETVDTETAERLEALGYVGGSVSARHLEDRPRGDPKDKIHLYNLLKQASTASAEGRFDEAIAKARQALGQDPGILEGHMLLGNFLARAGRRGESVAAYRQALALDPEHGESLFRLALAYKEEGRLADARAGFERARSLDPRNGRVLWQLADIAIQERDFDAAESILRDALRREVERERFLLKLAECQLERKRLDEAETLLREALAKKPTLETAHFNLGLVHEERGEREQAIAAYEKELAAHQGAYRAAFNLARLLQQAGRPHEALERFRLAARLEPGFAIGRLYLAKALLDAGDLPGAEREARAGLALGPDPSLAPLGHYVLADAYNRQGRTSEARREQSAGDRLARGVQRRAANARAGDPNEAPR
jgi:arylsulfatase A-like enzyme/cytochrome c-type biogenesis protein CcmH/NrfG